MSGANRVLRRPRYWTARQRCLLTEWIMSVLPQSPLGNHRTSCKAATSNAPGKRVDRRIASQRARKLVKCAKCQWQQWRQFSCRILLWSRRMWRLRARKQQHASLGSDLVKSSGPGAAQPARRRRKRNRAPLLAPILYSSADVQSSPSSYRKPAGECRPRVKMRLDRPYRPVTLQDWTRNRPYPTDARRDTK